MKHTKNMIYKPSTESDELTLFIENTGELYNGIIKSVISNLKKKYVKGTYDKEKAIDAFYYVANAGSQLYKKQFGYSFDVTARFTTAIELEQRYFEMEISYND